MERNRQLAEAFIDADPMPTLGAPSYTRFLKDFSRTNSDFGASVEKSLDDLIKTAKEVRAPPKCREINSLLSRILSRIIYRTTL